MDNLVSKARREWVGLGRRPKRPIMRLMYGYFCLLRLGLAVFGPSAWPAEPPYWEPV